MPPFVARSSGLLASLARGLLPRPSGVAAALASTAALSGSRRVAPAALQAAQAARLDDKVGDFLSKRFGPRVSAKMQHAHMIEEGRPVETVWDAVTAATAYAREIPHTADRVELETVAGSMLSVVS